MHLCPLIDSEFIICQGSLTFGNKGLNCCRTEHLEQDVKQQAANNPILLKCSQCREITVENLFPINSRQWKKMFHLRITTLNTDTAIVTCQNFDLEQAKVMCQ